MNHGIRNDYGGKINTGSGDDIITGTGGEFGIVNFSLSKLDGTILRQGIIDTGAGNDTITGTGNSGIGNGGIINTGTGNDTIIGTGSSSGISNSGIINTGTGNDTITATGSFSRIDNSGTIRTEAGNDIVDALTGGFVGNGSILVGDGNDIVKGFGSGLFDGGNGKDQLLFDSGTYTLSGSANSSGFYTISYGATDMLVQNFELISSANHPATAFDFNSVIGQTFTV
ncbi:hypothetical protein [Nostoc sp. FACHB-145]|uniref:hypothetical protein n=1 Tax=Nostoc sp. FACHB-145 TaxID=2692836 RepID=UPI0016840F46|nr:hypothetical protein [Nostoc sp. FACHB-145]MBD2473094.1 hypothetical protein [Nostoc sp. FACHB-145]